MKVGDLVMWLGKDQWHGMIGIITRVYYSGKLKYYAVQWPDGLIGIDLYESELMAVDDVPER